MSEISVLSRMLYSDYHPSGFYVIPALVAPAPVGRQEDRLSLPNHLALGPYHGRPGCLRIPLSLKRKGVCANAFLTRKTCVYFTGAKTTIAETSSSRSIIVQDVHEVPGHIACDGTTESEVVVPIVIDFATVEGTSRSIPIGVLDLDCQKAGVWTSADQTGLESIARWLAGKDGPVDWQSALGDVESAV